jgi:hypothetical protein
MAKTSFKLYEIKVMKEPLTKLIEKEIPVSIAFRLNKLVKSIDEHLVEIEEFRVKLINTYGERNEEKNQMEVPANKMKDFTQEMNTLLNETVELDITPININSFGDDLKLSTRDLMMLEKIFE